LGRPGRGGEAPAAGQGWLADHPERTFIARRYLARRPALTSDALAALDRLAEIDDVAAPDSVDTPAEPTTGADEEADLPAATRRIPLARQRRDAVLAALAEATPARILDLGCGAGSLLAELVKVGGYPEIVGVDVSTQVLRLAERRLRLDRVPERQRGRVRLWQSALTYTDDRLVGFDAAVLMEVIEHVDPPRLAALEYTVFGHAPPSTVVVTTPNVEYNAQYEGMAEGSLRHHDHRFEWTRAQFSAWATGVADRHGYAAELRGIGELDPVVGTPTQMAIFTCAPTRTQAQA
jgi:3' terminal RNA ribose 2'-O-methyltransferase Hen1